MPSEFLTPSMKVPVWSPLIADMVTLYIEASGAVLSPGSRVGRSLCSLYSQIEPVWYVSGAQGTEEDS